MAMNRDMSRWMTDLDPLKRQAPLTAIAIPGSHDSFSYGLDPASEFAPNIPLSQKLFGKGNVYKWSVTQDQSFMEQLESGIRYFDLRVAFHPCTNELHFVHGLFGNGVKQELESINTFLEKHPKEVVILDFSHFYEMIERRHRDMVELVEDVFGTKLCPPPTIPTLERMSENKQQVVALYDHDIAKKPGSKLWPGTHIKSPWPNTPNVDKMLQFLSDSKNQPKHNDVFYVCQGVLTPDASYIIFNLRGSLKVLGEKVAPAFLEWLKKETRPKVNIVITDFSDLRVPDGHCETCIPKEVVALNFI